ncbi:hypothetical protein TNCV_4296211 [Trichonephila clavipes]|nr:hypothetical protein TNCV_4296211 [Trichonephila clavipes]
MKISLEGRHIRSLHAADQHLRIGPGDRHTSPNNVNDAKYAALCHALSKKRKGTCRMRIKSVPLFLQTKSLRKFLSEGIMLVQRAIHMPSESRQYHSSSRQTIL